MTKKKKNKLNLKNLNPLNKLRNKIKKKPTSSSKKNYGPLNKISEKTSSLIKKIFSPLNKIRQKRKNSLKISKRQRKQSYNFNTYKENKDVKIEIEKRYNILTFIIILVLLILVISLFVVQVVNKEKYASELEDLTKTIVYGDSAPRGRIYDRNGNLLVDNTPLKVIYYQKPSGVTTSEEIEVAYKLAELISLDTSKLTDYNLRNFWVLNNSEAAKEKITDEEWEQLEERKITSDDILEYKIERVTEEELSVYTELDKRAAYIYVLMNTGYSYDEKVIKNEDVTDEEYALVSENLSELNGVDTKLDWERTYLYGSVFRSILGNVSSSKTGIPEEYKDYYLEKGYSLDDRVGTSNLEFQYEDILKGEKNTYQVMSDGSYKLIEEGSRGSDIVLTIDIELQQALEEILTEEVLAAKEEANTEYYDGSFVIITNPKTGEILAMAGKKVVEDEDGEYSVIDYTSGITQTTAVMGSVVKGASQIVGYNTGALEIGEVRYDTCVKIAATPEKCSWTSLGSLNDITALAYSSNTYQYYTAIKVGGGTYEYNQPLSIDTAAFDVYRETFAEFGLGVLTGIDLPNEITGLKGTSTTAGLLLDFSIGQYDNYTPIQLAQYISTIANNGTRMRPYLYKGLYGDTSSYDENQEALNTVDTEEEYLERVQEGFKAVLSYGTGVGYISSEYKPAGKTGTSQSFVDTDDDGVVDTETITTTFVAYAPYDDPEVTFTIVSPNVSHQNGSTSYQSTVTKRLAQRVSEKYFEIYS